MVAEVNPKQAWKMLQENPNAILLDVRSKVEFDYVGHPVGAVHVPLQEFPDWQTDPDFSQKVIELLGTASRDVTVLTLCRSGKRSMLAAQLLEAARLQRHGQHCRRLRRRPGRKPPPGQRERLALSRAAVGADLNQLPHQMKNPG